MSYTQPQPALPTMSGTWWAMPGAGLVTLVWLVGIYALILGVALVVLGFLDRGQRQASGSRSGKGEPS